MIAALDVENAKSSAIFEKGSALYSSISKNLGTYSRLLKLLLKKAWLIYWGGTSPLLPIKWGTKRPVIIVNIKASANLMKAWRHYLPIGCFGRKSTKGAAFRGARRIAMKWTEDQFRAYTARNTNPLVSAAAGSGKTAYSSSVSGG